MKESEVRIDGVPMPEPNDTAPPNEPAESAAKDAGENIAEPAGEKAGEKGEEQTDSDESLEEQVIAALREIFDPEIPVNIYDLGLIYGIDIDQSNKVTINMTLTSPACPVAESLPVDVRAGVNHVRDVVDCEVDLVWDPPWGPDRMTDEAKLKLGML